MEYVVHEWEQQIKGFTRSSLGVLELHQSSGLKRIKMYAMDHITQDLCDNGSIQFNEGNLNDLAHRILNEDYRMTSTCYASAMGKTSNIQNVFGFSCGTQKESQGA